MLGFERFCSHHHPIMWSLEKYHPHQTICSPHDKPTTMLCLTNKRRYFYAIYFAFTKLLWKVALRDIYELKVFQINSASFSVLMFSSFFAIFSTFVNSSYKMGERYLRRSCNVRGNHSDVSLLFSFWNIRITS